MKASIYFFIVVLGLCGCNGFNKIQKSTDVQEKYNAAIAYYEDEEYYKAGLLFEEIIPLIRGSKESEMAQFYFAYCHYYQVQYQLSAFYFLKFYETFGRSEFAEEALYMRAKSMFEASPEYYLDQSSTYDAIEGIQVFLNTYPDSKYKEECNRQVKVLRQKLEKKSYEKAQLYYKINDYKAAITAFEVFQQKFPDSDYIEEILFKQLEASFTLANQSIEKKKIERYQNVIRFYDQFANKYTNSSFLAKANQYHDESINAIEKLNNKDRNDNVSKASQEN